MTTLTDRYVYAALRALPEQQRPDIERELRGSIADAVDARLEAGEPEEQAERAVLTELGDPVRLAAEYVDRPLYLLGPDVFLDWWRLLKVLLAVVLPTVVFAVVLANLIAGTPAGGIVGTAIGIALSVAVHLVFWTTLVFALVERTAPEKRGLAPWTLERLPQMPTAKGRLADVIATTVFAVIAVGALVWQQFSSVFTDDSGAPIPLFEPALWSFWLPYFAVLILAEIPIAVAAWCTGRYTTRLAWINVAQNVLFAVPALWLLFTERLFAAAFFEALGQPGLDDARSPLVAVITAVTLGIVVWDCVDGFLKVRRTGPVRAEAV
ncbi:permease prefix domain 1-containing protein [Desertivibrio insolitus]|uniref:permease prefix domain 1-containing protein n=1 Tax=Herbiconiux sp. SYSU D00978 TaxID=2812562 RepID=UPI001A96E54C|nr:permease prefix domain 1-containing protein [Herbiconiux sp. SYSU D00978]